MNRKWIRILLPVLLFLLLCGGAAAEDFTIEDGVVTAYLGAGGEVTLPDGVTAVGEKAFYNCKTITKLVLPDSVTGLGKGAFEGCSALAEVRLSPALGRTATHLHPFRGCKCSYTVPAGTAEPDLAAFCAEYGATVYLEDEPDYVFIRHLDFSRTDPVLELKALADGVQAVITQAVIPSYITAVPDNLFKSCLKLAEVTFPAGLKKIGKSSFELCKELRSVTLPDGLTTVGQSAFNSCTGLEQVILPDSVTAIQASAFNMCISLEEISIPGKVTAIRKNAFRGCSALLKVILPESVATIEDRAFDSCHSLRYVFVPAACETFGTAVFTNTSSRFCIVGVAGSKAQAYAVDNNIPFRTTLPLDEDYSDETGKYRLNDADNTAVFIAPANPKAASAVIPDTLEVNGVTVKVTSIAKNAFKGRTALKKVVIGKNVKTIGKNAFSGCKKLAKVSGGAGLVTIGEGAFRNCRSLAAFTFQSKVKNIRKNAFNGCKKLKKLTFKTKKPTAKTVGDNAFAGIHKKAVVKCPKGSVKAFKAWLTKKGVPGTATIK